MGGAVIRSRRRLLSGVAATALGITLGRCAATDKPRRRWQLSTRAQPAVLDTEFGPVAYFAPNRPRCVVVLIHGYPWPDGWLFGPLLLAHVRHTVRRWTSFAREHAAILLAPAMGAGEFAGYREMAGRRIDPDQYVNRLVDNSAGPLIQGFDGRFVLHGHSAGGQFAARYLPIHPTRVTEAILSAPSSYPFPDPAVPWPNGMAPAVRGTLSGDRDGSWVSPDPGGWLHVASECSVTVLVGSRDTEPRPFSTTQHGTTRVDRATAWVKAMNDLAELHGKVATVKLLLVPGLGHDEAAMAEPAQRILCGKRRIS
jgi:pimeloyl-ACP methyl ester carboxylesterase